MAIAQDKNHSESVARQATEWFVRLNNPLAGDDDRRAFRLWLEADATHAQAMEEIEVLWRQLDVPAARLASIGWHRIPERKPWSGWLGHLGTAGIAATSLVVAVLMWRDPGLLDRIRADHATRPGERREVQLSDGSRALLDGDTAIAEHMGQQRRTLVLMRGRAWFDVRKNKDWPFVVQAGAFTTEVLGTAFSVDRQAGKVIVEHGTVVVSSEADADAVRLTDNERVRLVSGRLTSAERIEAGTSLGWTRGLIVLDAAPLSEVLDELGYMTPGRVMIADGRLADLKLSGVFRADDPGAVLEAIHTSLGLRMVSVPGFATVIYR